MPTSVSQKGSVSDVGSYTNQLGAKDASEAGRNDADADHEASDPTSTHVKVNRNTSTSSNLPSGELRNHSVDPSGLSAKIGRQSSHDGLIQIPPERGVSRRPLDTSIWDWDPPLESTSDSSSYYYEPQGELLQESQEHRVVRNEFNIPTAIPGSSGHWPFPPSAVGSNKNDEFAVPRRPSGVPPSVAGNKRKSTAQGDIVGEGKQLDQRHTSRIMSDSGGEPTSPADGRPPAHSTRSQSGTTTRQRSSTDNSEGGQASLAAEAEAPRSSETSSGPRRTLTDPSIPMVLPARKVFPIQIGNRLFRLSGASISSDGKHFYRSSILRATN